MMKFHRTSTFRLTAMLGLAFLCALAALLGLIYLLTERELLRRTDEVLASEVRALAPVPAARLPQSVQAAILANASHLNRFALIDASGHEIIGNFTPPRGLRAGQLAEAPAGPGGEPALRLLPNRISGGGTLVLARDISQIKDLRHRMLAVLLASGLMISTLLVLTAVVLSVAPLRRVRTLTALAIRIAAGELTLRMPISGRGDELDAIATTVNTMIEEIARLMLQVKGATDAIAHDLRSPLADLRGQLEQIRRRAVSANDQLLPDPQLPASIEGALDGLDAILARFSALLRIAELEATNRQACFAELEPMVLAGAVCELFEPLAEERGIALVLSGTWGHIIHADEKLLFEALSNLVENAIKFIDQGGNITVKVTLDGDAPVIIVRDDGPGIPVGEQASVLRRYHRGSRAQHTAGSGLGLSLVAEIVHLHGYVLALEDGKPGLEVRIVCKPTMK